MQAAYSRRAAPERTAQLEEATLKALRHAARSGAIPTETPAQQRRVVSLATLHRQSNPSGDYPTAVYEALRSIKGIDQWTRRLLDAANEVDLAWQARGAKLAHLTPDAQLRAFERHLRSARGHLVAAHRLHPERPEAAAMMIKITLGLGESATKDIHYWFEQAVNAEIDWVDTYINYDWAIRPRWGGSHEQMIDFGEAAWDTQRFDTFVPLIRVWMHTRVSLDTEELKAVWHAPDTLALGTETIATLLDRPEWRDRQNYLQTIRASMCYWAGDWDQFKLAWDALERDNGKAILEPDALAFMAQKDHWLRYSANHYNLPE